jgi:hypothetical protein
MSVELLHIEFGPKFCQAQCDQYLSPLVLYEKKRWSYWELSFLPTTSSVLFDLTIVEWIDTEQIVFLFAWVKNLKFQKKVVKIRLPYRSHLKHYYSADKLKALSEAYRSWDKKPYEEDDERVKRRQRASAFLMAVYGLYDRTDLSEGDFENMADYATYNRETRRLRENNHQIIPFTSFDLSLNAAHLQYDTQFYEVIHNHMDAGSRTGELFQFQKEIRDLLLRYDCYSPFETKIISNVITQELYTNSLQHSFDPDEARQLHECYMSAFLANQWGHTENKNFLASFLEEKYPETLDFFKDKTRIAADINRVLEKTTGRENEKEKFEADLNYQQQRYRLADLSSHKIRFRNESYLEYCFLDFGAGIPSTLGEEFTKIQAERRADQVLSKDFENAFRESQILEFAFLLDTSRDPLDKTIEFYGLVPRGLYFLIDMVRRYKGLLVARSGRGKIVYDFSDRVVIRYGDEKPVAQLQPVYQMQEAIRHVKGEAAFFPGTLLTIYLPNLKAASRQQTDSILSPIRQETAILADYAYSLLNRQFHLPLHPKEQFYPESFRYVSILLLYNEIIENLKKERDSIHVKEIYNRLFTAVDSSLNERSKTPLIVFFDFAGLRSGNTSWIKILYYLLLTPKINEYQKAIIVNLPKDEDQIIKDLQENFVYLDVEKRWPLPEPFLFKPIPCIQFKIDATQEDSVEWIGLKDKRHAALLTQLLLGKQESYQFSQQEKPVLQAGNLFVLEDQRMFSSYQGFQNLKERFLEQQSAAVSKFLQGYIESGIDPETAEERFVFLTANGGYQFQYLSLYELLHDKYVARYFAKQLLDKYCLKAQERLKKGGGLLNTSDLETQRFQKIITVTVSSQLLGVAIRDLIEEDDNYSFLRKDPKKEGGPDSAPDLIMLSSYYAFDTEKPFERILESERVLIVNDVISTGNLVKKLIERVEINRRGIVNAVFSLADSRVPLSEVESKNEIQSEFFGGFEERFFTLANFDSGICLRKYKGPYTGKAEQKRINPLLNTIVELKAAHGEQKRILFKDPSEIVSDPKIASHYFKVGHFQQNLTHNGFLTDMRPLFGSDRGVYIIEKMKKEIEDPRSEYALGKINVRFANLESQIQDLSLEEEIAEENELLAELKTTFEKLRESVVGRDPLSSRYRPDFIFYPVFSGIEKMSAYKLSRIFDVHPDHIIGLQRFETPKGWRFPFPAKRYNELTRNRSVLILDSGSLTGESLVQLIDNVSFLDVKDIMVLSVITRVDDFYREFYSRIKSIKVKRLKTKEEKRRPQTETSETILGERIVPVEIFFGINLHIPVYTSSVSCPFCDEWNRLGNLAATHWGEPTTEVNEYVAQRRDELKWLNSSKDTLINSNYLPSIKNSPGEIDTKGIFLMRDLLGKIDSYRFYPDYFIKFNMMQQEIIANTGWMEAESIQPDIERVLICLLHEPSLFDLVKNYLSGLVPFLKAYLSQKVFRESIQYDSLHYQWSASSLLQLCFLFMKEEVFTIEYFERILSWNDKKCNLFMHYQLWDHLYNRKSSKAEKTVVELLLQAFSKNYEKKSLSFPGIYSIQNKQFIRLLTRPYQSRSIGAESSLDAYFYNLDKFVLQGEERGRHFYLKEKLNEVIDSILTTKPSLKSILHHLNDVLVIFDQDLMPNVKGILDHKSIKQTCEIIYRFLSYEKEGILYYMTKLEEAYHRLLEVDPEGVAEAKELLQEIRKLCALMVNKTLTSNEEEECFFRICKQYPSDLVQCLEEIKQKETNRIRVNISKPEPSKPVFVNFNKEVLEAVLQEIFRNAKIRANGTLELEFALESNLNGDAIKLRVTQNFPFRSPSSVKNDGGLTEVVENFVVASGGRFADNRDMSLQNGENYQMNLTLKLHQYDN